MEDEELNKLLAKWTIEAPPPDLLDRIVRSAIAQPQRQSIGHYIALLGEPIFGTWNHGLAMRCATLLICMMAGIATGHRAPHEMGMFGGQRLVAADDILGLSKEGENYE